MISVHLSVTAAVRYFRVYKLIEWGPANIYLQQQDTIKRSELCPELKIKRVESRSSAFIVNFE